jgi:hypothetical protein|tara:strand:+ start:290 stop:724 length:435 start_codon:yes stop_codon:yes gene_type:complete
MSLLDEHKESLPEGVYLEMCDNLKKLYLTGEDFARDSYLIDLTNEYYSLLEDNESLRHEIVQQKRDLLRANVTRFERVSRPALVQPRGMLESLLLEPRTPPISGISVSTPMTTRSDSMDHDSREIIPSVSTAFGRVNPTRIGRH